MATATAFAHPQPWTVEEWLALNDSADRVNRYELLDGTVLVTPSPSMHHQYAGDILRTLLDAAAPPELVAITTVGVWLGDDTAFIPDVLLIDAQAFSSGHPIPKLAEVRLVVEVVSPSTRTTDRSVKPEKYAAAGVPHFWRVELENFRGRGMDRLPILLAHELDRSGEYRLGRRLAAGTEGTLDGPFPFTIDPAVLAYRSGAPEGRRS